MRKIIQLGLIFLIAISSCKNSNLSGEMTYDDFKLQPVNEKYIKFYGEAGVLGLEYSNIIYKTSSGKALILPIFNGDKGSIGYEDLRQYCIKMGKLRTIEKRIRPISVKCKKNYVKKTFYEFLSFYKSNLFKNIDIEHPTDFGQNNDMWVIYYDFLIDSIPCFMRIQIDGLEESSEHNKSIYRIQIDETQDSFIYHIAVNARSPFYEKNKSD